MLSASCSVGYLDILVWFAFELKDGVKLDCTPVGLWKCFAFATWAAIAFIAFVLIDVSQFLVSKYSFRNAANSELGIKHGFESTLLLLVVGAIAAWVVGAFAYFIDLVNPTIQTSAAVGVLWQVVYAQMLARLKGVLPEAERGPPDDEMPEQTLTTEEFDEQA